MEFIRKPVKPLEQAWRFLMAYQLSMYVGLALCVILLPRGLAANHGMSYFGVYARTIVPYGVGLLAAAFFAAEAANVIPDTPFTRPVRLSLYTSAVLTGLIVVTPYNYKAPVGDIHESIGTLLFLLQTVTAGWVVYKLRRDRVNLVLLVVMALGGIMAAIYLGPVVGFLMQGQLVFQAAYGAILLRSVGNFGANVTDSVHL